MSHHVGTGSRTCVFLQESASALNLGAIFPGSSSPFFLETGLSLSLGLAHLTIWSGQQVPGVGPPFSVPPELELQLCFFSVFTVSLQHCWGSDSGLRVEWCALYILSLLPSHCQSHLLPTFHFFFFFYSFLFFLALLESATSF